MMPASAKTRVQALPMTPQEVAARGWDAVDVVFVTGDAYVDHPSFAMALLGRLLEDEGYRVAILSQPDWRSCEPWRAFGRPRLAFAVSAGNMDSMLNHYTAGRKVRNDDAYSPGGQIGLRPDRATAVYCQRGREAFPGVPVIAGGVEASLRRIAHYDYWSDKVRRAVILDAKADLIVYGMGERPLLEILARLGKGEPVNQIRDVRGTVYRLGASESPPAVNCVRLPSFEEVVADKKAFARMTHLAHLETNPFNARCLVQFHARETVVINPPAWPLDELEIDRVYGLPYTRQPHPSYGDRRVPALEVVKDSIQIMRGCFGGCSFCSITAHEGRVIQSRSRDSILAEIRQIQNQPGFKGIISDLGGPTANMYRMNCSRPDVREKCRRLSCVHPRICRLLNTDHGPLIELMKSSRALPGIRKAFVASGVRMDLAHTDPEYLRELAEHHTGGLLKVAPEHTDPQVLELMKKPEIGIFRDFDRAFRVASKDAGKEQYLVPYFISGHPGCTIDSMIELALFLKRNGYRPDKVQDFIPSPMDLSTCIYHTGLDPMSGKAVSVPRGARERRFQRALLQYFKPGNYFDVRQALEMAGRRDLIGDGPECLIPTRPPRLPSDSRNSDSGAGAPGLDGSGYRPHRKTSRRRQNGRGSEKRG